MSTDLNRALSFNFNNASVAMIDSSPLCLEVMTNILAGYGFRKMHRCADLAVGTETIKSHGIDLLLIDPMSYGEGAYDLIRWLRAERFGPNSSVPIIITTAHTRMRLITTTRQCGADYIVAKPFSTACLLERILWVATSEGRRGELIAPSELVNTAGSGVDMW
ncbi:MAG: response regulator [Proteobacteria bacterium]|nr:response regulator [Pseudomonadota bacterium]